MRHLFQNRTSLTYARTARTRSTAPWHTAGSAGGNRRAGSAASLLRWSQPARRCPPPFRATRCPVEFPFRLGLQSCLNLWFAFLAEGIGARAMTRRAVPARALLVRWQGWPVCHIQWAALSPSAPTSSRAVCSAGLLASGMVRLWLEDAVQLAASCLWHR